MILLDTHIFLWWVDEPGKLSRRQREILSQEETNGLGVSVISCWEIVRLAAGRKIALTADVDTWLDVALKYPGVRVLDLDVRIAVESAQLPAPFHRDPADRFLVATARQHKIPLLTSDSKILNYPHVTCVA